MARSCCKRVVVGTANAAIGQLAFYQKGVPAAFASSGTFFFACKGICGGNRGVGDSYAGYVDGFVSNATEDIITGNLQNANCYRSSNGLERGFGGESEGESGRAA